MNHPFSILFKSTERRMLGLMTGTSLDGIDIADVHISGSGDELTWSLKGYRSVPYRDGVKEILLRNSQAESASLVELTLLGDLLAQEYEEAILFAVAGWHVSLSDFDAVGVHGQTMYHHPDEVRLAGRLVSGSFQAGDPSVLAARLGLPVIGDFRVADMALGGQGAPLVPYFDYVTFRHATEHRMLINLGGIANATILPANADVDEVYAFDTGPGNMILDALAVKYLDAPFDEGGEMALRGTPDATLLAELLKHPFFDRKPPRSTGRELFSARYVNELIARCDALGVSTEDLFASVAAFTADSILCAWERFVKSDLSLSRILISGGGVHNRAVMDRLEKGFHPVPVQTTYEYDVDPDAKEAICFAVLAHETLNGVPTNIPGATGASRPTVLGKICFPGPVQ